MIFHKIRLNEISSSPRTALGVHHRKTLLSCDQQIPAEVDELKTSKFAKFGVTIAACDQRALMEIADRRNVSRNRAVRDAVADYIDRYRDLIDATQHDAATDN